MSGQMARQSELALRGRGTRVEVQATRVKRSNDALVEAAYAYKDNEAAAQPERQAIKRQVEEICARNPRPRPA